MARMIYIANTTTLRIISTFIFFDIFLVLFFGFTTVVIFGNSGSIICEYFSQGIASDESISIIFDTSEKRPCGFFTIHFATIYVK